MCLCRTKMTKNVWQHESDGTFLFCYAICCKTVPPIKQINYQVPLKANDTKLLTLLKCNNTCKTIKM